MKTSKSEIIFVILLFTALGLEIANATFNLIKKRENLKSEKNYCIRMLVNEDIIPNGCDKYFQNDKFYQDFMNEMNYEYNKIR